MAGIERFLRPFAFVTIAASAVAPPTSAAARFAGPPSLQDALFAQSPQPAVPAFGGAALFDIDARTSDDAWAVGVGGDPEVRVHPVAFHWDGTLWSRVHTPHPASSTLQGVSIDEINDAWAVGGIQKHGPKGLLTHPLVMRWRGGRWNVVPLPVRSLHLDNIVLWDVSANAPDDVWTIGDNLEFSATRLPPVILHWDGAIWTRAKLPEAGGQEYLNAVWAAGFNDVWAVGWTEVPEPPYVETLTLHWDGRSWTRTSSPNPARHFDELRAVSGDGGAGAWAVGDAGGTHGRTLVLHWSGSRWRAVSTPTGGRFPELDAVSADAPDDAWAVGGGGAHLQPMILHWDGLTWSRVGVPHQGIDSIAYGVAALSSTDALAVGEWDLEPFQSTPLFLRWDGSEWRRI